MAVGWVTYIWNLRCSNLVAERGDHCETLWMCQSKGWKGLVLFRQCSLSSSPYLLDQSTERDVVTPFPALPNYHDYSSSETFITMGRRKIEIQPITVSYSHFRGKGHSLFIARTQSLGDLFKGKCPSRSNLYFCKSIKNKKRMLGV